MITIMWTWGLFSELSKIGPQIRLSAQKFQKIYFALLSLSLYFLEKIKNYTVKLGIKERFDKEQM